MELLILILFMKGWLTVRVCCDGVGEGRGDGRVELV
jgi:hypothetical protein